MISHQPTADVGDARPLITGILTYDNIAIEFADRPIVDLIYIRKTPAVHPRERSTSKILQIRPGLLRYDESGVLVSWHTHGHTRRIEEGER